MDQALALHHHQLHNLGGEAIVLGNLGLVALDQGDYKTAKGYHEQSLGLVSPTGQPFG